MRSSVKFSTREWWLLILIMVLAQFIVHWLAYQYGGSPNALGYISFAGTLVSIVLGLIAIIYSFVQSISQTSTVIEIREQVDRLISAGEDIAQSKSDMHASAIELSGIADELTKRVSENTSATQEFSGRINKMSEIFDFGRTQFTSSVDSSSAPKEIDGRDGRSIIYSERILMTIMILAISEGAKRKFSVNKIQDVILRPYSNMQEYGYDYFCGALTAVAFSLEAEGLLELSEDDALEVGISVKSEFERHMETLAPKTLKGDNEYFTNFWLAISKL